MRFAMNDEQIIEVLEIEATPCWNESADWHKEPPSDYIIELICDNENDEYNIRYAYKMDGTMKTYEKARENFRKVCHKMLVEGWCSIEDFENVDQAWLEV